MPISNRCSARRAQPAHVPGRGHRRRTVPPTRAWRKRSGLRSASGTRPRSTGCSRSIGCVIGASRLVAQMDAATILARTHSARGLPVRPDISAIEREVRGRRRRGRGAGRCRRRPTAPAAGSASHSRCVSSTRSGATTSIPSSEIVTAHPRLLHEDALIRINSNWGPPMTLRGEPRAQPDHPVAARAQGAKTSSRPWTVPCSRADRHRPHALAARRARVPGRTMFGPAETLNAEGMSFLVELGVDRHRRAGRGRHGARNLLDAIRWVSTRSWSSLRGRASRCPTRRRWPCTAAGSTCWRSTCGATRSCFSRTFTHEEMFPPELGCHERRVRR